MTLLISNMKETVELGRGGKESDTFLFQTVRACLDDLLKVLTGQLICPLMVCPPPQEK